MSKKKPVRPTKTKPSVSTRSTSSAAEQERERPEFELIRFDRKVLIYISVCLIAFFILVALKWHNSSIPRWNEVVNDGGDPERGLLAGKPLRIRSDEWLVGSSFTLAQHGQGYPVSNDAVGYGKSPLIMGLPTDDILSVIRPALWGYYVLDIERAFAWQWNFKIFPFLIATFLLLMLFTRNHFLLSLFGSIWLLLSSAIQWWSISTEMFTYGCLAVIAFIYLLYSDKPKLIIANGVLLTLSAYSYAMVIYPAYQVPLAYFLLALIVGYMLKNKNRFRQIFTQKVPWKLVTAGFSVAIIGYLLYMFYQEAKDTIDVVAQTVYPGQRNEKGGDFVFLKMFTDNFSLFMNQEKFPVNWGNICELSSFLMLSPIASVFIIIEIIKTKKVEPLLLSVLVFQLAIWIWLFFGFPEVIAKYSFFKTSPTYRTFFVFGFANCIATILFLAHRRTLLFKNRVPVKIISFVIILIVCYIINAQLNKQGMSYFTSGQVGMATLIFAGLNWMVIHFNERKNYQYAFYGLALLFVLPNLRVNPYSYGLSPYFENNVFKTVSAIKDKDPDAGWLVFGNFTWANYIKAAGIKCYNGVQYAPPLDRLHILDPSMANDSIYNRYAHVACASMIDGRDSIKFTLKQSDMYSIQMDPCSPRLTQLNIKYILFTYEPQAIEVQCMTLVENDLHLFVYKRNDQ
ncbi:MAG: hypothetical protein KA166_05090 [Saprospiraceae bacterium]|nr:hypothetical protein [Saprospiraceae bacterium]